MEYRTEKDTLGEVKVPRDRYFGAQTQRAVENFPVSGLRLQPVFVRAQATIKWAAAKANMDAGALDRTIGEALVEAADELMAGKLADEFVVDVFQAGAGTSQNMNVNEVLANRAHEILGGRLGEATRVHPNDHANMSQSTNDTIHTAIHVAAVLEIRDRVLPAMARLEQALARKAEAFEEVVKCGRTHMQDAVPLRLGQEFGAYASMLRLGRRRIEQATDALRGLCIGGTAVGTGLNTPPGYRSNVIKYINKATGESFRSATDLFEAMQNIDAVVEVAGALRVVTVSLRKIAADLILLSSGPRAGLGELRLPAVQPGSSIMPGKVNPVMAEMLSMVCFHALGCDAAIVGAAQFGQLELNVMMPVVAYNLLQEIDILAGGMEAFTTRCVTGIEADEAACRRYAERSPSLATALSPHVGYHRAAELAMESLKRDALVRDLALEAKLMPEGKLNEVLDVRKMTGGQDAAERSGGSD